MIGNKFKNLFWILPLFLIAAISCIKEDFFHNNDKEQNIQFKLSEARSFFEKNASDLKLTKFSKEDGILETKASGYFDNIIPLWNKSVQSSTSWSELYEVPLRLSINVGGVLKSTENGKKIYKTAEVVSHLVIEKFNDNDSIRYFISTVIGINAKKNTNNNPFSYNGRRNNFVGIMIISDVNGKYLCSFYYKNGKRFSIHFDDGDEEANKSNEFGFVIYNKGTITKGGTYNSGENEGYCFYCHQESTFTNMICDKCKSPQLSIDEGGYYFCKTCGVVEDLCTCPKYCSICNSTPCVCRVICSYCHMPYCNGECHICSTCGSELNSAGRCPICGGTGPSEPDPDDDNPPPTTTVDSTYTLNISVDGGGSVIGAGNYQKGVTAIIFAVPNDNYVFGGWSGGYTSLRTPEFITINRNYNIISTFYLKTSDCGKLITKYKNSSNLKTVIQNINDKKNGNNFEHAYTMTINGVPEYTLGTTSSVNLDFDIGKKYEFVAHNHSQTPIPSLEDLLAIHKAYQAGCFEQGSFILMQTTLGTMSVEIEDFAKFDLFASEFSDEETLNGYKRNFHKYVLGNPSDEDLKTRTVINKAINFFSKDKGLRIAYSEDDGSGINWAYAVNSNNILTFNNCLN